GLTASGSRSAPPTSTVRRCTGRPSFTRPARGRGGLRRRRPLLALAIAAAAAALAIALDSGPGGGGAKSTACNGSAALCHRRLDQFVSPGTHNSFAASDEPGWYFANQRYAIARQLDDG